MIQRIHLNIHPIRRIQVIGRESIQSVVNSLKIHLQMFQGTKLKSIIKSGEV